MKSSPGESPLTEVAMTVNGKTNAHENDLNIKFEKRHHNNRVEANMAYIVSEFSVFTPQIAEVQLTPQKHKILWPAPPLTSVRNQNYSLA